MRIGTHLYVDASHSRIVGGLLQSTAYLGERVRRRKAALLLLADVSAQLHTAEQCPPVSTCIWEGLSYVDWDETTNTSAFT